MTSSPTPAAQLTVVLIGGAAHAPPALVRALAARPGVQPLWLPDADVGAEPGSAERATASQGAARVVASLVEAVSSASAPWLALRPAGMDLPGEHFDALAVALQTAAADAGVVVCGAPPADALGGAMAAADLPAAPPAWHACALRRERLLAAGLQADARLRPELAADLLLWRALLLPGQALAWAGGPGPAAATAQAEPPVAVWRDKASYAQALQHAFVEPIEEAAAQRAGAPRWLQLAVLRHLSWYFTVDSRERAPTVVVDEPMAVVFHQLVGRALRPVDMRLLEQLPATLASPEVCHALWSYQGGQHHSAPVADAYDHDQGLMRLTYWHHGTPPAERVVADRQPLQPAFAKQRACNFFRRRLLRQRIAWLPVADKAELQLDLAGRTVAVAVGRQPFSAAAVPAGSAPLALQRVRANFRPGKADLQQPLPAGWAGWKVRLIKALARFAPVRWTYRDAWVFVDRDVDADDNAEHLYRWVREHHPELNAWYLLQPTSPAWRRLQAEGFRLLAPGPRRRLLALNCKHIVSSHVGQEFGLAPAAYGDMMLWRYSFLQHGVTMHDVSHWLNPPSFDVFVTASPAEHEAIVGNDTPYVYTGREVHCTGFPRHDRLRRIAREEDRDARKQLLVMPTWRGSLIDERMATKDMADRMAAVARSDYVRNWRAFLNSPELHDCLVRSGWRLVFMPHTNALPFIENFSVPTGCEVRRMADGGVQQSFASAALFVTDYTSVAFDMAFLRRPIVYFQFDRDDFYAGGHNWRPGYFDYDRDGFGPVTFNLRDAVGAVIELIERDGRPNDVLRARMVNAMPGADELACRRVFASIAGTSHVWQRSRVEPANSCTAMVEQGEAV